jgi:hypothetical protein
VNKIHLSSDSTLWREEQAHNAQARELYWKPLSWLGTIRPSNAKDAFDPAPWTTFVSTTLSLEVPVLSSLPRRNNSPLAKCGCKKHCMDVDGDHTANCTAHSGATKAHGWLVGVLGPLFHTAGHTVRTQHGATGKRRPTARRRGNPQLHARSSGQPELGLRPVHHTRPLRLQQPRAAARFAIASPGPCCAFASCCAAQN